MYATYNMNGNYDYFVVSITSILPILLKSGSTLQMLHSNTCATQAF